MLRDFGFGVLTGGGSSFRGAAGRFARAPAVTRPAPRASPSVRAVGDADPSWRPRTLRARNGGLLLAARRSSREVRSPEAGAVPPEPEPVRRAVSPEMRGGTARSATRGGGDGARAPRRRSRTFRWPRKPGTARRVVNGHYAPGRVHVVVRRPCSRPNNRSSCSSVKIDKSAQGSYFAAQQNGRARDGAPARAGRWRAHRRARPRRGFSTAGAAGDGGAAGGRRRLVPIRRPLRCVSCIAGARRTTSRRRLSGLRAKHVTVAARWRLAWRRRRLRVPPERHDPRRAGAAPPRLPRSAGP